MLKAYEKKVDRASEDIRDRAWLDCGLLRKIVDMGLVSSDMGVVSSRAMVMFVFLSQCRSVTVALFAATDVKVDVEVGISDRLAYRKEKRSSRPLLLT